MSHKVLSKSFGATADAHGETCIPLSQLQWGLLVLTTVDTRKGIQLYTNKVLCTMSVSGWMFLLVLAHPGCPGENPKSHKMVVCVRLCMHACVQNDMPPPANSSSTRNYWWCNQLVNASEVALVMALLQFWSLQVWPVDSTYFHHVVCY